MSGSWFCKLYEMKSCRVTTFSFISLISTSILCFVHVWCDHNVSGTFCYSIYRESQHFSIALIEFCIVQNNFCLSWPDFLIEFEKSNINFIKFKTILLDWKCNDNYFHMLYVKIKAMRSCIQFWVIVAS